MIIKIGKILLNIFISGILLVVLLNILFFLYSRYYSMTNVSSLRGKVFEQNFDFIKDGSVVNVEEMLGIKWDIICFESSYHSHFSKINELKDKYPDFNYPALNPSDIATNDIILIDEDEKIVYNNILNPPTGYHILNTDSVILRTSNLPSHCFARKDIQLIKNNNRIDIIYKFTPNL